MPKLSTHLIAPEGPARASDRNGKKKSAASRTAGEPALAIGGEIEARKAQPLGRGACAASSHKPAKEDREHQPQREPGPPLRTMRFDRSCSVRRQDDREAEAERARAPSEARPSSLPASKPLGAAERASSVVAARAHASDLLDVRPAENAGGHEDEDNGEDRERGDVLVVDREIGRPEASRSAR